jgi:hypothetical protein
VYTISLLHKWDRSLVDQAWWKRVTETCGAAWVDSLWEVIYKQWKERNFVGVVVQPLEKHSYKWLGNAVDFGVPIWVYFPNETSYPGLDGTTARKWEPSVAEVRAIIGAERARFNTQQAASHTTPPPRRAIPGTSIRPISFPFSTNIPSR